MPKPSRSKSTRRKATKTEPVQPTAPVAEAAERLPAMFDPADEPKGSEPIEPEGQGEGSGPAPDAERTATDGEAEAEVQPASEPEAPTHVEHPLIGDEDEDEDDDEVFDQVVNGDPLPDDGTVVAASPAPPQDEPEDAEDTSTDFAKRVRLGPVEGKLYRIPVAVVQELLGSELQARVATLQGSQASQALHERLRATDGHCAPVIMTAEGSEAPLLFSGIESVAAALDIGLSHVDVVTIDPGDAGAAQSWLAQKAATKAKSESSEDDFVMRVNSYYDD